ncbi:winged helix-turn-helix domain-containing protein [Streptomyces sp. NPDC006476]|uniref:helix-turn-helix domain-containing protein n=1 Tax=Streptomyces sp. NPDC006476 TaxID=3157175 RepID=UPI00339E254D
MIPAVRRLFMPYAQGGRLTPAGQVKREAVRLEAAKWFEAGAGTAQIAAELRVTDRSVRRWRAAWRQGGAEALASAGPMAVERLSSQQWQRLEAELKRGPLAHGFDDAEQGWTLKRVKLLIGRLFHVGYTVQGVWRLLKRHGWSCQVPVRRALERLSNGRSMPRCFRAVRAFAAVVRMAPPVAGVVAIAFVWLTMSSAAFCTWEWAT